MTLPQAPRFHVVTLGGLSVEAQGVAITSLASQRKALAMLALLAANGSRGMSRDKLMGYLWPDAEIAAARNALSQLLYRIRRELGADAIVGNGDLRLDDAIVASDVDAFRASIAEGDVHAAIATYRGLFLDGVRLRIGTEFDRWVETERQALSADAARVLNQLAADAEARHDVDARVRWQRRRADRDPLNGATALQYMDALVAAGSREEAIRHARLHASLVRAELEADADPAVLSRAEALRTPDASAPPEPHRQSAPAATAMQPVDPCGPMPSLIALESSNAERRRSRARWRRTVTAGVVGVTAVALVSMSAIRMSFLRSDPTPPGTEPRLRLLADVRITRVANSNFVRNNGDVSLDGRYAFAGTGTNSRQLTRVELATGDVDTIAQFDGDIDNVRVSPDGKLVAATVRVDILATERKAFDGVSLWVVGADGSRKRILARPQFIGEFQATGWTPDSRRVLVLAQRDGSQASGYNSDSYAALVSVADGTMREIGELGPAWPLRTRISPDGRLVAYTHRDVADGHTRVRVLNVATGASADLIPAIANERLIEWTADGTGVLFSRERGQSRDLCIQDVSSGSAAGTARLVKADVPQIAPIGMTASGRLHYLINAGGPEVVTVSIDAKTRRAAAPTRVDLHASDGTFGGVFSPDGRYLAYLAHHGVDAVPGTASLVIQTVDGAEIRELPLVTKRSLIVNWTADSRRLLVRGDGQRAPEGHFIDIATGRATPSNYGEPPWNTLGRPAILPDGSVLRGIRDTTAADHWQDADNKVVLLDGASGRDRVLGTVPHMVRLIPSPDGKAFIAVVQGSDGQTLHVYSIADGRIAYVRRLAPLAAPLRGRDATSAIWSADGKSVVVAIDEQIDDNPPSTTVMRYPLSGASAERLFDLPDRAVLNSVHPDGLRFAFLWRNRASMELWALDAGRQHRR